MDKETFFFTLFIVWYFNRYIPAEKLLLLLYKLLINTRDCLEHYNNITNPFFEDDDDEDHAKDTIKKIKYENKYLEELRGVSKEFVFTEVEQNLFTEKTNLILKTHKDALQGQLDSLKEELEKIEEKFKKYEGNDDDYTICSDEEDNDLGLTIKERRETLISEKKNLLEKQEHAQNEDVNKISAEEEARNYVIKCRLEKLKNVFILEHTPLGNVLMVYDVERESFKYYSDNSIPYRYLETAARKYVKQLDCRPIYIDMEEELNSAEERIEHEKKKKELLLIETNNSNINNNIKEKKNVFAKFKNYNKESGTGHVIMAGPPKNSIPNSQVSTENAKIALKEKTNRYTYEGKMANFSFLKKIDRKVVDKKYAMTFADFKQNVLKDKKD